MKNNSNKDLREEINKQMELIFSMVEDDEDDGRCILLFALLNKALSEILDRPVTHNDLFDDEQHMAALKLIEQWIDRENFGPRKIH